jgi:low affinity Fe/Cu permease
VDVRLAGGFVVIWLISGPLFGFSDTWQLVMNTISSVVTFLMVFLIQNTQNRDSAALQVKIDELIRATSSRQDLIGIEERSGPELDSKRREVRMEDERKSNV